jgi:signal transduction histidine kinase
MKILIAEDDATSRTILTQILKQLGHEVVVAVDGEQAWGVFLAEDVPLLISDWMMPGLDGLELCRRIRADGRAAYTYIILLTVLGGKVNYLEAMKAGADDFISKPFDREQLTARLRVAERILGLQRDLTRLELTQEQLVRQERLRALGEMASGVVHDLNNALVPIVGYTSMLLLKAEALDDRVKIREHLQMIATAGEDASQLVRALREFYRHRDHTEVFEPVILSELLATAVSLTEPKWRVQTQAAGRTIRLVTELEDAGIVDGNSAELRDVFTNLIFNAVDAMPDGGTLTVRAIPDPATSSAVAEVADSGTGMTPEVQRRCFEPFFTTKGQGGTGLGLARVYGIIQRHHGTIEIDSAPGRGTTIRIRLPLRTFPEAAAEGRTLAGAQLRPLNVLLVEDEPVPLQVVERLLTGDGHTVSTARNGLQALEKFQTGWFDAVVTDHAMPEMSGTELALMIKRLAPRKPVIVMLTGVADVLDAKEKPPGVDIIIDKPVTLLSLREALSVVK